MRRAAAFLIATLLSPSLLAQTGTPQSVADELLAADRAFSKSGAKKKPVDAISAMFAQDVVNPVPGGFAEGKNKAVEAMKAQADNVSGHVEWTPVRVALSADGLHGVTWGYMTLSRQDNTTVPISYLAYWIKGAQGWRVASYKRRVRAAGEVSLSLVAPVLPDRLVAPTTDAATIAKYRDSLATAEKNFSDEAQNIGIGPAFEKHGSAEAMNIGGPKDAAFLMGNVAIAQSVGQGSPGSGSPVSWAADHKAVVASSGDLGISLGYIRQNAPGPDGKTPPAIPFFTIWRRANTSAPWRYVAE